MTFVTTVENVHTLLLSGVMVLSYPFDAGPDVKKKKKITRTQQKCNLRPTPNILIMDDYNQVRHRYEINHSLKIRHDSRLGQIFLQLLGKNPRARNESERVYDYLTPIWSRCHGSRDTYCYFPFGVD